jgi:two-component system sensor histidine kinase/response regulator
LRQEYLQSNEQQEQDSKRIASIAGINQQMSRIQIEVGDMLEKAATQQADEAQMYRFHSDVVNRLSVLQKSMDGFEENFAYKDVLVEARRDFQNYKNFIIMATDLAAIDPLGAMRHAFSASQAHVKVAEHSQSIANTIAAEIASRSKENTQAFEQQAMRTGVTGAAVMALVLILWMYISERVTRRLTRVSEALSAFANDDIDPPTLPLLTQLSEQKSSLLRDMAVSVLAFRQSVISRKKAQYDLGERMKELSCLYDVKALTENRHRDLADMFEAIALRLPAAMRYPDIAAGWIIYQGRRYRRMSS